MHASEPDFLQQFNEPFSSALTKESSRMKRTHVTNASCPGRVSKTPRSCLSCVRAILAYILSMWNQRTAASQIAINLEEPKATTQWAETSAAWLYRFVDAEM